MEFPDLSNYRGLIFDLDGTVIDSMPHHVRAWVATGAEHGFEVDPKLIYAMGGVSSQDVVRKFRELGHETGDIDAFVKEKVARYREHIHEVELFESVAAIVRQGHEHGQRVAIASGTQRINGEDILRIHHLTAYIDALVCGDDVTKHKPHPETFLTAAAKIGLEPHECVVFEDGKLGVEAALAGGFDCVEVKEGVCTAFHMAK